MTRGPAPQSASCSRSQSTRALFFDELPGWMGMVGIALIGGAGAMAVWRPAGEPPVRPEEEARPR
ncbi:hypothetical protein [Aurantimonas sp. 22II-16-19i]|uniref:hypothetical protein n=1 Tax=Aurantimonas sp. 22II-16-19i TaxID=1317114 RepID=UPI00111C74C8|nr:hypothetical protein [Aurantimonas sp. 22II-16-19i]